MSTNPLTSVHHGYVEVVASRGAIDEPDSYEHVRAIMDEGPTGTTAEPVSASDVAEALIALRGGRSDTQWIQKMLYVAQALQISRNGEPMYRDEIQAWREGPVVPTVFKQSAGAYGIHHVAEGDKARVERHPTAQGTLREAMRRYGSRSGDQLVALTHLDPPWTIARGDLPPEASSDHPIPVESIREYSKVR